MKFASRSGIAMVSGRIVKDAKFSSGTGKNGNDWYCTRVSVASDQNPAELDEKGRPKTVFTDVVCWGSLADLTKDLAKGDTAMFIGTIQSREYTGQDGQSRKTNELNATEVYFGAKTMMGLVNQLLDMLSRIQAAGDRQATTQPLGSPDAPRPAAPVDYASHADFTPVAEDEDLPF